MHSFAAFLLCQLNEKYPKIITHIKLIHFRYKPGPAIADVPRRARLAARPRGRQQVRVSLLEARVREPGAIIQVTLIH